MSNWQRAGKVMPRSLLIDSTCSSLEVRETPASSIPRRSAQKRQSGRSTWKQAPGSRRADLLLQQPATSCPGIWSSIPCSSLTHRTSACFGTTSLRRTSRCSEFSARRRTTSSAALGRRLECARLITWRSILP